MGDNKHTKTLYELSEYLYYLKTFKIFSNQDFQNILIFLDNLEEKDFIENSLNISREDFRIKKIAGIDFKYSEVKYPLVIHQFKQDFISEIIIKEKQKALGIQAMLFYCFPITTLSFEEPIIGRTAKVKEKGFYIINKDNANIFIEMTRIFGILSRRHNYDIKKILEVIIKN